MMIVFGVFSMYQIEDYYDTEDFLDVFSTREKAQEYIDGIIRIRKLDCKQRKLEEEFGRAWEAENPGPPYENTRDSKPKYNHALASDREYNRQHEALVHEWRATVERPAQDRQRQYMDERRIAVTAYMATIDMEQQDLSDIDLEYYGVNPNLYIKELEVK